MRVTDKQIIDIEMKFRENGKRYYDNEPSAFDIVGKWEE